MIQARAPPPPPTLAGCSGMWWPQWHAAAVQVVRTYPVPKKQTDRPCVPHLLSRLVIATQWGWGRQEWRYHQTAWHSKGGGNAAHNGERG